MLFRIFAVFAALFFVPQSIGATVHSISYNVATSVALQDNDTIKLVDFPVGWGYNRVVLGVNSVPSVQLLGKLLANGCVYELHGYYEEIDFAYAEDVKIVYHGPSQNLPIQWWVDAGQNVSSCKSYAEIQHRDSVANAVYDFIDSSYSSRMKEFNDLGGMNSTTIFEGRSGNFKITDLPKDFYNLIYVQVVALDGRELDGFAYAGGGKIKVDGFSAKMVIEQKLSFAPTFELAFPEKRKVKLTWWPETRTPNEIAIEKTEKILTADSVEVEYAFEKSLYTKNPLKIVFDRRKFRNGEVPEIKKLSFNPRGPDVSRNIWTRGSAYDINANLNYGDSVVVALPVEFDYRPDRDTIVFEHWIEEENRMVETPIDSVVDNYAFVKVDHFCLSWLKVTVKAAFYLSSPTLAVCAGVSKKCRDAFDYVVDKGISFLDALDEGLKWVYNYMKDLACSNNTEGIMNLFQTPRNSNWDIEQGWTSAFSVPPLDLERKLQDYLVEKRVDTLVKLSEPYDESKCKNRKEACKWERTRDNLEILLADAVSGIKPYYDFKIVNGKGIFSKGCIGCENLYLNTTFEQNPEYREFDFDDYFMVSSGFVEDAATIINGMRQCSNYINPEGSSLQKYIDLFEGMSKLSWNKTCNAILGFVTEKMDRFITRSDCQKFLALWDFDMSSFDGRDDKMIAVSEAMVRISLLSWLRKTDDFRNYILLRYNTTYNGVLSWLDLMGPFLDYNNIAIKAYGSLALYEYVFYGTDDNLTKMNAALDRHYGDNGGFSEGTGYSQFVWDDVPYVLAALKDAAKNRNENIKISDKFLKSPDYMFEFSRPVGATNTDGEYKHYGLIPVEVDDGVTYNPDFRVWAKLTDNPKYLAMSKMYPLKPEDQKMTPLVAFGVPDSKMYFDSGLLYSNPEILVPNRGDLWGGFKDGIGLITAVSKDKDTIALSMIAENGNLWTRGQAHDQQDNLSITLTSSKKGFLIQDPGYSGFSLRSKDDRFHRYVDHNVLTDSRGQEDNRKISFSDLWSRVYDFTEIIPGVNISALIGFFELLPIYHYSYTVEGGNSASVLDNNINEPQNGIIGYTATMDLATPLNGNVLKRISDNRTIMYFGDNFWVIDRPNEKGLVWTANSPIDEWSNLKIYLYGSLLNPLDVGVDNGTNRKILQHGNRSDYEKTDNGEYYLQNYKYTAIDVDAKTYVMNYALGEDSFAKESDYCPNDYQCFMNLDKTLRVVVPPAGEDFKLCDALPYGECFGDARSSGITMFKKMNLGKWTTRWVLDGELYALENNKKVILSSATVTWSSFLYEKSDGLFLSGKYKGTYLPALPILLRR